MHSGRCMVEEEGHGVVHLPGYDEMIVVENEMDVFRKAGEVFDDRGQNLGPDKPLLTLKPGTDGRSQPWVEGAESSQQVAEKEVRIVVGLIDRIPGYRQPLPGDPLTYQRSLAGTCRTGDQRKPAVLAGRQPFDEMPAGKHLCPQRRYVQLRAYEHVTPASKPQAFSNILFAPGTQMCRP